MRCRRMMFPANIWIKSNERAASPTTTRVLQTCCSGVYAEVGLTSAHLKSRNFTIQSQHTNFFFILLARDFAGIEADETNPLISHEDKLGGEAVPAVPTPDHYLPLLYVVGARQKREAVTFPVEGVDGGSISMLAVRVGDLLRHRAGAGLVTPTAVCFGRCRHRGRGRPTAKATFRHHPRRRG